MDPSNVMLLSRINQMYNTTGFVDKYGFHLVVTIIIICLFMVATSYFIFDMQLRNIKRNWSTERCKPLIMPLAGIINAPDDMDKSEYASQNFSYCTSQFFKYVFETVVSTLYYITGIIVRVFKSALESINKFRLFFDQMREQFLNFIVATMRSILNFIIPFVNILVKLRDMMRKMEGIFLSIIYMLSGGYMALKSLIGTILTLCIIVIVVLIIIMIIMWVLVAVFWTAPILLPFHPPLLIAATTFTLTVIAILIPFCIVAAFAGMVFKTNTTVPKVKNKQVQDKMAENS
jgi:hypothetical protein